jgi:hypothetical protein
MKGEKMKVYLKHIVRITEVETMDGRVINESCQPTLCIEMIDGTELKAGHAKLIGQWREPSFEIFADNKIQESHKLPVFIDTTGQSGNSPGWVIFCGCNDAIYDRKALFDHWQRGHFDVPIYEEI